MDRRETTYFFRREKVRCADMPTNPYESPTAMTPRLSQRRRARKPVGPFIIAALLVMAVLVGFVSLVVPSVRVATMPRFGWSGLTLCINPLIFLLPWFWKPTKRALMSSAFMTASLGVINAVQLFFKGTVPVVANDFHDRLHSSWLWAVVPFFVAGGYLCWLAVRWNPLPSNPESDELSQTLVPQAAPELP
jgi:hypothetical protein